jgi:hypothetical protein
VKINTSKKKNTRFNPIQQRRKKRKETKVLTTPTLTLSGLGSARKASVTPRIGSLGAGSTLCHHDDEEEDMNLVPNLIRTCWRQAIAFPNPAIFSRSLDLFDRAAAAAGFQVVGKFKW